MERDMSFIGFRAELGASSTLDAEDYQRSQV